MSLIIEAGRRDIVEDCESSNGVLQQNSDETYNQIDYMRKARYVENCESSYDSN